MADAVPSAWPTELRLADAGRALRITFEGEAQITLAAELLRVRSPSAAVQGHGPRDRRTVAGKRGIAITAIEPVGHYAVRLIFADGHDTGLFTWAFLHELGHRQEAAWAEYQQELDAKGLSRD